MLLRCFLGSLMVLSAVGCKDLSTDTGGAQAAPAANRGPCRGRLGDDGTCTYFDRQGRRSLRVSYTGDELDGQWTAWYPNGQKKIEGIFHNDMENGPSTQWAPDGRKMLEGSYRDGQYHGKWKVWNEAGELSEFEYMNGVRIR